MRQKMSTLMLRCIPVYLLDMATLCQHFKRFGSVVNVEMHPEEKRALVQFSKHEEALKAFKSPVPVCRNRFIQVSWASAEAKGLSALVPEAAGAEKLGAAAGKAGAQTGSEAGHGPPRKPQGRR